MSKLDLQKAACENSGISYEQSLKALNLTPTVYERLGKEEGVKQLSTLFYDRIFSSEQQWFLNIFSSSTKDEAIDNQFRFLVQTFGGPNLYKEKKGKYTRLVGRHANYPIGTNAAILWVKHMVWAMEHHGALKDDLETRTLLHDYFNYTAHYIVSAMQFMRSDQLSGGTQIDPGRVW